MYLYQSDAIKHKKERTRLRGGGCDASCLLSRAICLSLTRVDRAYRYRGLCMCIHMCGRDDVCLFENRSAKFRFITYTCPIIHPCVEVPRHSRLTSITRGANNALRQMRDDNCRCCCCCCEDTRSVVAADVAVAPLFFSQHVYVYFAYGQSFLPLRKSERIYVLSILLALALNVILSLSLSHARRSI